MDPFNAQMPHELHQSRSDRVFRFCHHRILPRKTLVSKPSIIISFGLPRLGVSPGQEVIVIVHSACIELHMQP
jgi:hypothetical protein